MGKLFKVGSLEDSSYRRQKKKTDFGIEETLTSGGRFDEQTTTVVKSDPSRLRWLQFAIAAIFIIIVVRTGYLQVGQGEYFREQSDRNAIRTEVIPANRGVIYDRDRQILVQNKPSFDLVVWPNSITKEEEDLTDEESSRIVSILQNKYKVEGELRRQVSQSIRRLIDISSYRGSRHKKGLPARGQRTKCNARTRKGPKPRVGGIRKKG